MSSVASLIPARYIRSFTTGMFLLWYSSPASSDWLHPHARSLGSNSSSFPGRQAAIPSPNPRPSLSPPPGRALGRVRQHGQLRRARNPRSLLTRSIMPPSHKLCMLVPRSKNRTCASIFPPRSSLSPTWQRHGACPRRSGSGTAGRNVCSSTGLRLGSFSDRPELVDLVDRRSPSCDRPLTSLALYLGSSIGTST